MRYFPLLCFLTGVVGLASCGRKAAETGISVDRAFRPLIPADAKALAGVDLDKLKSTPLYQRHENSLNFPLLDESVERIGLDPRRDLSEALVVWNGKQPVFITRGRFNSNAVEQKLVALGAQQTNYRRRTTLTIGQNSFVFLKNSVVVAGPMNVVQAALNREEQGSGEVPEELAERLRSLPRGDQIWAVSGSGLPFAELPMRSDYESALSNITGYISGANLALGVDTGLHFIAELTCTSQAGAQRVHDGLRAAVALGRLTTKDNQQDLLRIYDSIHVDQDHQIVRVEAAFPADLADKLLADLISVRH